MFTGQAKTDEVFKDIKGYEGLYQISNYGVVKNANGKLLTISKNQHGYPTVKLSNGDRGKRMLLHRLLAIAFIPNPNNHNEINHINGIKSDNKLTNLEWCDRSHNIKHSFDIGLNSHRGSRNSNAKLTEKEVTEIRILQNILCNDKLSKLFGVRKTMISQINLGQAWKHI